MEQDSLHQCRQINSLDLEEMDQYTLRHRHDVKYIFHDKLLLPVLEISRKDFLILRVNDEVCLPYTTWYYDTPNAEMYLKHHDKEYPRFKVRKRQYCISGESYLEIKKKSSKNQTSKERIRIPDMNKPLSKNEKEFLQHHIPLDPELLEFRLAVSFNRLSLVNPEIMQRVTIDSDIIFATSKHAQALQHISVAEIKQKHPKTHGMHKIFKSKRIKAQSMSKYCIGNALLFSSMRRDRFNKKLKRIQKIQNT